MLSLLNFSLNHFILNNNLNLDFSFSPIRSVYSYFSVSNWTFFKTFESKFFSSIDFLRLKQYKCVLRSLVKTSYGSDCFSLIRLLNVQIRSWNKLYKGINSYYYYASSLDFYLYKLLWKWCKRSHPRRSNSWIFGRYWVYFFGSFKFCFTTNLKGKVYFLHSHLGLIQFQKVFPFSFSHFCFYDKSKLEYDWFFKLRHEFNGIYGLLFDFQRGICPCCNKSFVHSDLQFFRILYFSSPQKFQKVFSFNSRLILIHASCYVY